MLHTFSVDIFLSFPKSLLTCSFWGCNGEQWQNNNLMGETVQCFHQPLIQSDKLTKTIN